MHRRMTVGLAVVALLGAAAPWSATAAPAADTKTKTVNEVEAEHEMPNPLEDKRRALRTEALTQVLSGEAKTEKRGSSTVVKLGDAPKQQPQVNGQERAAKSVESPRVDQFVELAREKTDKIFVILTEFGNDRHPQYPDQDTHAATPGPARFDGPLHNEIPAPNRGQDNATIWQPDYSKDHFQKMYFGTGENVESLKTFYERQSSGRYSVDGLVTDWVKVKYNEARYGRSNGFPCPGSTCNNTWELVKDGVNQWAADRKAAGETTEQIKAKLAEYDTWDRYDYDADGDFNEPDGYLDHFQIVHSGGDQADGDPHQGEDAIWSHRWYAYNTSSGQTGPGFNKRGGAQIGDTGIWVGDYTIQPENGGLGVFAHEYGHDLGLPDHYDTAGPGGASENGVNWWSLMGQSRVSPANEGIGTRAADLSAWDKLQLGWLDYETVVAGQDKQLDLGPHEYNSDKAQGVVVVLPDKQKTSQLGAPFAGANQWWSGQGDDVDNTLTREVDLTGKAAATLSLKARYDIEVDFDYVYAQYSTDNGANWTALDGTLDGKAFPKDAADKPAITDTSGGKWVDTQIPLTPIAGKKALVRFRYITDGGVAPIGFFADDLKIVADGQTVFTDGAESGNNGWTLKGFRTTTGTETKTFDHFYVATNRTYASFDKYMQVGPYNYGWPARPRWAERFPYQDGLLISYWDTSQVDNNTSAHPGEGLILPIDANPDPIYNLEGQAWRPRIAGYDAPFSLQKSDSFTLHVNGKSSYVRGQSAKPLFDDTKPYWSAAQPTAGVKVPGAGVGIRVLQQDGTSMKIRVFSTK
ncbi:immune inhibitor A domain-containing protein [Crossiella cryophila]|uniref:Immune inhibitor A n=1 Tax=Crossiella cryophila TaxID=43355 RepID=A0A7W7CJA1_9PSEU|nr:immune inhibitor A domain-containing protein [Crossiella cryophila]MBB4681992.1 immune inhibitor A [Crossiella cryophila]